MGIRSRLKGAIKRAVLGEDAPSKPAHSPVPAPASAAPAAPEPAGGGNLADGEDVPWYLKDGDADGWDNTDAQDDLDED